MAVASKVAFTYSSDPEHLPDGAVQAVCYKDLAHLQFDHRWPAACRRVVDGS